MIECNLGNLALFQGNYDRALDYLERSRRGYAVLEMPHEFAIAELAVVDAYLELNLAPEAAAVYGRVIPTFAELGMRSEQAWALAHHAHAGLLLGQLATARAQLATARALYAAEEICGWRGNGYSDRGANTVSRGRLSSRANIRRKSSSSIF